MRAYGRDRNMPLMRIFSPKYTVGLFVVTFILLNFRLFGNLKPISCDIYNDGTVNNRLAEVEQWESNTRYGGYDLVYTWVNGSDPEFFKELSRFSPRAKRQMGRFRDYDTLLYALRSADKYFGNLNHIYILTNGQVPSWLNTKRKDISIVTHAQVFPNNDDLPTFSSHSIEANLHLIPGLNERFMYCNDDMPFGNKIEHEDLWIEPDTTVVHFSTGKTPRNEDIKNVHNIWRKACMHSNDVLNTDPSIEYLAQRHHPAHHCYNMRKSILEEMERRFGDEFNKTRTHKFRQPDDVDIPYFYANFAEYSGEPVKKVTIKVQSSHFGYMNADNALTKMMKESEKITKNRPKFLCIQDAWGGEDPTPQSLDFFKGFMADYYPEKSRWEL